MKKKLLILTSANLNSPSASNNRKISLAKGFEKNNFEVKFVSYRVFKKGEEFTKKEKLIILNIIK